MKKELENFQRMLRLHCPELLGFWTPGLDLSSLPADIILPVDLAHFYEWSGGVDVHYAEKVAKEGSLIVPEIRIFDLHYFPATDVEGIVNVTRSVGEDVIYTFISQDDFGDHFLVRSDGCADFVYFLEAGSEEPIPAFPSFGAFISTINHLLEAGATYYELDGNFRRLKMANGAPDIARLMNETDETREYWSGGFGSV